MKITEKQLHLLMIILKDSCMIDIASVFSFDMKTRVDLFNSILKQQSDDLIDVKGDEHIES